MTRRPLALAAALSLLVAVGVLAVATPASAANLLGNPGFESGTLSPWSCTGGLGSVVTTPGAQPAPRRCRARRPPRTTPSARQTVAVQPNTAYTLTGWVRGNYVYLGVTGGASTWTPGAAALHAADRQLHHRRRRRPRVQVYLHGWYGQGTYFADDISLDGPGGTGVPGAPGQPGRRHDHQHLDRAVLGRVQRHGHRLPGLRGHHRAGHRHRHLGDDQRPGRVLGAQLHGRAPTTPPASRPGPAAVSATTTGCTTAPPTPAGLTVTGDHEHLDLAVLERLHRRDRLPRLRGHHRAAPRSPAPRPRSAAWPRAPRTPTRSRAYNANGESAKSGRGQRDHHAAASTPGCPSTRSSATCTPASPTAPATCGWPTCRPTGTSSTWPSASRPRSTSGDIRFRLCPVAECPNVETEADFIAAIRAKQAQGKKVLLSIGGAERPGPAHHDRGPGHVRQLGQRHHRQVRPERPRHRLRGPLAVPQRRRHRLPQPDHAGDRQPDLRAADAEGPLRRELRADHGAGDVLRAARLPVLRRHRAAAATTGPAPTCRSSTRCATT